MPLMFILVTASLHSINQLPTPGAVHNRFTMVSSAMDRFARKHHGRHISRVIATNVLSATIPIFARIAKHIHRIAITVLTH